MRQLVYTSLLLITTLRFTCGEKKTCSTIKILKILWTWLWIAHEEYFQKYWISGAKLVIFNNHFSVSIYYSFPTIWKPISTYERLKFLELFLKKIFWKTPQLHQLKLYWEQTSQLRHRGNIAFNSISLARLWKIIFAAVI